VVFFYGNSGYTSISLLLSFLLSLYLLYIFSVSLTNRIGRRLGPRILLRLKSLILKGILVVSDRLAEVLVRLGDANSINPVVRISAVSIRDYNVTTGSYGQVAMRATLRNA
jgi:hypothetical protein